MKRMQAAYSFARPGSARRVYFTPAQVQKLEQAGIAKKDIAKVLYGGSLPVNDNRYGNENAAANIDSYKKTGRLSRRNWTQTKVPLMQRLMRGHVRTTDDNRHRYLAGQTGASRDWLGRVRGGTVLSNVRNPRLAQLLADENRKRYLARRQGANVPKPIYRYDKGLGRIAPASLTNQYTTGVHEWHQQFTPAQRNAVRATNDAVRATHQVNTGPPNLSRNSFQSATSNNNIPSWM